jgi:polysaccharide deacetylase family protein (PEP-CTERM system associated)
MIHAFTVDLEEWFHGIPIAAASKAAAERRLHVGTDRLLELLDRHRIQATFFALGPLARENPGILRRISGAGHHIGSHGVSHDLIYEMTPERFREETRASVRDLEDCIGQPVRAYRAAYFSITQKSLWAFDVLAAEGIRCDSSVFPVRNWRYGIPGFPRHPVMVSTDHGPLYEFPISTRRLFGRTIPITGGAYFRIYPYALTRANIRAAEREGFPIVFYLHPWELDVRHPVVRFRARAMLTHYVNLGRTRSRLERLLRDFRFSTLEEVLADAFPQLRS